MQQRAAHRLDRADAYGLETYLAIRVATKREDAETERVRGLHAKAAAELAERQRQEEVRREMRRRPAMFVPAEFCDVEVKR